MIKKGKNKTVTYVLLAVVALVWGTITYKVVMGLSDDEEPVFLTASEVKIKEEVTEVDSFSVIAKYRDPFLGKAARVSVNRPANNNPSGGGGQTVRPSQIKKTPPKPVGLPRVNFINYLGYVTSEEKNKVALLLVSNENKLLNEGESIGNFKLEKIYEDSIKIFYQNQYVIVEKR